MKWISTIKAIGKKAVDNKDGMVILFGEGANKDLEDVSVIQKFGNETPVSGFVFKKGDTVTVDGQTYVASYVGPMVESNMKALGHATLFFNCKVPKTPLANAVYFEPDAAGILPNFKVDDDIVYEHI
ncbi:PTS glucitol/sorbitol transporter subunit IIA [Lactobacillus kefiranofaciens]|uniref:PTS glucitol/sorbitol transporter subunit IIA n=1 Tax=Lactobacillus kefiranofaciens TaxID=267818 RepID=A0AAX3UE83_9LACO|nr:PTS glucitol/sorbitol transporter subunit IIA [Lactobacillus kefiranofaciens]AEG40689.1 PTS system, enzyme IIA component (Glucitol/sorbitol-specific) [Lactobacillus kefiranofaciens subsp. kefiranofaciens]KRM22720.1 PTS system glucitol sorbitol-specific transporter subunit IIA [Lactobacillus kefiranofaciens subsp. kefiranofaciens DSM 5016 = JCM 6985]MCJ2171884.1 PTS glucitol/sorbitol transporter subunit IIA [Lactobacillus kefiranofaciens]MCP9330783.1 PTS glucitol/sorbitol transporter subunit 